MRAGNYAWPGDGARGSGLTGGVQMPLSGCRRARRLHRAPGRRGTTEPDGQPDRRARTRRTRDGIGAGRGPRGDRRGRQLLRRDRSGGEAGRARRLARRPRARAGLELDDVPARRRSLSPDAATSLRLVRVGRAEATAFGRDRRGRLRPCPTPSAVGGKRLPGGLGLLARARRRRPAAAAGVFLAEGVGYLGFAATLPEHRGKGGQNALLAARIRHAREAGCDVVVTETGERRDDRPSSSYRNILRAGVHRGGGDGELAAAEAGVRRTPSRASVDAGSARPSAPAA